MTDKDENKRTLPAMKDQEVVRRVDPTILIIG